MGGLGGPGGIWEVPESSLGILGGRCWVLVGSLGRRDSLEPPGGFLVSLGAPLEVLGPSHGRPLEVLGVLGVSFGIPGGAWVALMEPLGGS